MSFCTSTITKTSTFLLKPRRGNRYWKLNSRPRKIQLKPQFRVFPIRRYSPLAAKFSYPFDALVTKVEFCYSLWRLKYLKYVDVDFKVQVPLCVKETFPLAISFEARLASSCKSKNSDLSRKTIGVAPLSKSDKIESEKRPGRLEPVISWQWGVSATTELQQPPNV